MARIGGRGLNEIFVARGRVIESDLSDDMCRTQITVELSDKAHVNHLLLSPLGNHHLVVEGDHLQAIEEFMGLFIKESRIFV